MGEVQKYLTEQRNLMGLLNSNKRHLINIKVAKLQRLQRLIAYLLVIFVYPLLLHNVYLKRYSLAIIEAFYLWGSFYFFSLGDEAAKGSALQVIGTYIFGVALIFFFIYDCVTIPSATAQNARKRKRQLYKEEGILPVKEMLIPPEEEVKPLSQGVVVALGKKVNTFVTTKLKR